MLMSRCARASDLFSDALVSKRRLLVSILPNWSDPTPMLEAEGRPNFTGTSPADWHLSPRGEHDADIADLALATGSTGMVHPEREPEGSRVVAHAMSVIWSETKLLTVRELGWSHHGSPLAQHISRHGANSNVAERFS